MESEVEGRRKESKYVDQDKQKESCRISTNLEEVHGSEGCQYGAARYRSGQSRVEPTRILPRAG